ncbi:MAG: hypothetical protein IJA34_15120 [Lachnospiraceae bacterium]|nr:hypothetical protein [Lachnospiraceae bacterium]
MDKKINKIYVIVFGILFFGISFFAWFKPADDFSYTERRHLDKFPTLNKETILSGKFMSEFEEYTLDQFPFRDDFRSIKSINHLYVFGQKDNNDVYIADGYVSKIDYPLSEKTMNNAINKFNSIYKKYIDGTDAKVYYSIIPDKNCFLAEKNGYPAYSFESMKEYMNENLSDMKYIDIYDLISVSDFYYTDTHWKQENIIDVAKTLSKEMGVMLEAEYEKVTLDIPFYGVYYGQLGLPMKPDKISYLNNKMFEECIIVNHETGKEIPMYSIEKAKGRDPYEMFLSGSISVITIENPNATTSKELVIFRDSYGSSLVPLLVEGYSKITMIDARYINERMIGYYVDFDKQDVLFIHSSSVINNPIAFK